MKVLDYKCSACDGSKVSAACDCRCGSCGGTAMRTCRACYGKGRELLGLVRCSVCDGTGKEKCYDCNHTGAMPTCQKCNGSGKIPCSVCTGPRRPCASCGHLGVITAEESSTVQSLGSRPVPGGGGVGILFGGTTTRSEFLYCEHCGSRTSYPAVIEFWGGA